MTLFLIFFFIFYSILKIRLGYSFSKLNISTNIFYCCCHWIWRMSICFDFPPLHAWNECRRIWNLWNESIYLDLMKIANIVLIEAEASKLLLGMILSQVIYLRSSQPVFQRFVLMVHSHFLNLPSGYSPSDFLTKISLHSFLPILIICSVSRVRSWEARDMIS